MSDTFDPYRDEVANYAEDMQTVREQITEAANNDGLAYIVAQPDVAGTYYEPPPAINAPTQYDPYYHEFRQYRVDVGELVDELGTFVDTGEPDAFDAIIEQLTVVGGYLEQAQNDYFMSALLDILNGWSGGAADQFRDRVLAGFNSALWHQAKFVEEIARAVWCYARLVERGRGDALGLAQDLKTKVKPEGGLSLGTVLWVIGSIAAGVATFGSATTFTWAGAIAYSAGVSEKVFNGIASAGTDDGDRAIEGVVAEEFIPSCRTRIQEVIRAGVDTSDALMAALKTDLADDALPKLRMDRPELMHAENLSDLGAADDTLINDEGTGNTSDDHIKVPRLIDLIYAGDVLLPAMASFFDVAHSNIVDVCELVDAAIGESPMVSSRHVLAEAVAVIADAMKDARDFLYWSGEALSTAAKTYAEIEALNDDAFAALLADREDNHDAERFPLYRP